MSTAASVPIGRAPEDAGPSLPPAFAARVLLIDDSPVVLESVGGLLQGWGHTVETALDADLGLRTLEQAAFDLVVTDVNMPGRDGLALLGEIHKRAPELPVIMLSSSAQMSVVLQAIHAGAFDYVHKDDGLEALGSSVRRALEHVRLSRENRRLVNELRAMNRSLDAKVRERTAELEEANRRLQSERSELHRTLGTLRHTQSQLIQAEKMATIGLFTAGIAHEINNPLAFLIPNFEGFERWVAAYREGRDVRDAAVMDELEQVLQDCREGLSRIARIVKQVSIFAHPVAHDLAEIELLPLVAQVFRLVEKEAARQQALLVSTIDEELSVRGSEDELQQVLLNVVLNAIQSFPATRRGSRIEIGARQRGRDVVLTISDNGCGIAQRNLDRVFEPFFTTKAVGQGTGLGLSISRRLVQRMGGRLELSSEPDQGTTVVLTLSAWTPAAEEAQLRDAEPGPAPALGSSLVPGASAGITRRGHGAAEAQRLTVVVIDDEPSLLQALKRVISPEHEIVPFLDPVEAKEWLLYGPSPDVVLCDIMMPSMTGIELYREVVRTHPWLGQRFVFITGVSGAEEVQRLLPAMERRILEKPIAREELLAICRELGPRPLAPLW